MDLHAEIMNIPANVVLTGPEGVGNVHSNPYIAYKEGHRDARHAAAELALKAERRIEALEEALRWYIEEDEINEWQEGNEYWIGGKHKAMRLLGMEIEE